MATLSAPTIEDLIQNVRNMLGQPSSTNSTWTDEELAVYLNEAVRRYFVEVVHGFEGEFTTTAALDITSGTDTVALPSDFFKIKAVYRKVANGYEVLPFRNHIAQGFTTSDSSSGDHYLPSYYLRNNSLVLRPQPNFTESSGLLLEYVQFPETLVTGGDQLTAQVSPIFRDLIEAYGVWKAKVKESLTNGGATATLAHQNLNDLFTAFKETVHERTASPTFITPFDPESGA